MCHRKGSGWNGLYIGYGFNCMQIDTTLWTYQSVMFNTGPRVKNLLLLGQPVICSLLPQAPFLVAFPVIIFLDPCFRWWFARCFYPHELFCFSVSGGFPENALSHCRSSFVDCFPLLIRYQLMQVVYDPSPAPCFMGENGPFRGGDGPKKDGSAPGLAAPCERLLW